MKGRREREGEGEGRGGRGKGRERERREREGEGESGKQKRREQESCDYIANTGTCNHMQNRVGVASSCIPYQCVIVIVL